MIAPNARASYPAPMFAVVHATRETIPPITDTMGRSWRQPDFTELDVSGETVELTQKEFDTLHDYSTSWPTGVYPGKCWKAQAWEAREKEGVRYRHWTGTWFLRWFGECDDPTKCSNNQRTIAFINQRKEPA